MPPTRPTSAKSITVSETNKTSPNQALTSSHGKRAIIAVNQSLRSGSARQTRRHDREIDVQHEEDDAPQPERTNPDQDLPLGPGLGADQPQDERTPDPPREVERHEPAERHPDEAVEHRRHGAERGAAERRDQGRRDERQQRGQHEREHVVERSERPCVVDEVGKGFRHRPIRILRWPHGRSMGRRQGRWPRRRQGAARGPHERRRCSASARARAPRTPVGRRASALVVPDRRPRRGVADRRGLVGRSGDARRRRALAGPHPGRTGGDPRPRVRGRRPVRALRSAHAAPRQAARRRRAAVGPSAPGRRVRPRGGGRGRRPRGRPKRGGCSTPSAVRTSGGASRAAWRAPRSRPPSATGRSRRCSAASTIARGDVVVNPAGTVHALGGGVLAYEVQQASDLTYRLYDHGRVGADGRPRELHVARGLDVADLSPGASVAPAPRAVGTGPHRAGPHPRLRARTDRRRRRGDVVRRPGVARGRHAPGRPARHGAPRPRVRSRWPAERASRSPRAAVGSRSSATRRLARARYPADPT